MIKPTREFQPFGEKGPKVALFGRKSGNWSMNRLQNEGDHLSETGLYFRFCRLGEKYHFSKILAPSPIEFNTTICSPENFSVCIQNGAGSVAVLRGCKADGVLLHHGQVGAIPTADCPTIVVYDMTTRQSIIAHAGLGSLVDINYLRDEKPPRQHFSVVDSIMQKSKEFGFCMMQVFITCGIRAYERRDLVSLVNRRFPHEGVTEGNYINLQKLIAFQFAIYGIEDVETDTIDTYGDLEYHTTEDFPVWHSYRRDCTSERNLILVLNNSIF